MPRERRFSEPEVLERLTDVFATHGYASTSLALLQEATGLGKQSLYNTFGDKQAMYLQAIDCAVQRASHTIAAVQAAKTGRLAIEVYFEAMVASCTSDNAVDKHCIVTSGLLEGLSDAPLAWALTSRWQSTHELLRSEIERGQRDGSIVSTTPSTELAELMIAMTSGLRVAAQAGRSRAQMERSVALAMSVLDRV
ncbi:TetR/AcrR family transcriptional regulator [Mitsuaria sp. 7]|uniref:TetR/AcrR family transcriptional regulator n=1 Tax=Mitsuaria sp. 7 TaxID=1658665 RepID=UPI0007DDB8D7|nr:TetR/AcrR family transcriptional regulator [Mitsuaria sp. 7]ANH66603.1 TetR family transcriptional regulator [Mitsuaria sp. 7]